MLTMAAFLSGCASVEMTSKEDSMRAKQFNPPSPGNSGVYIYRDSFGGRALKKDIWIDRKCVGESAPDVFFYTEVKGGKDYEIATESEFSPNSISLMLEAGKNYFIRQFIKVGAFVGGAGLAPVSEKTGQEAVMKLEMAKLGYCSSSQEESK